MQSFSVVRKKGSQAFCNTLEGLLALAVRLAAQQRPDGVFLDFLNHFVEHGKAFFGIFLYGVVLPVASEADSLLQLVHVVDMVHPGHVHGL